MALAGPAVYGKQSGLGGGGWIEPLNGRQAGGRAGGWASIDKLLSPTSISPTTPSSAPLFVVWRRRCSCLAALCRFDESLGRTAPVQGLEMRFKKKKKRRRNYIFIKIERERERKTKKKPFMAAPVAVAVIGGDWRELATLAVGPV